MQTPGNIELLLMELHAFRGGLADTSTLIYLERLGLLELVARCFSLWIIPQVAVEYGSTPRGTHPLVSAPSGSADEVLCRVAQCMRQPVLSEDKHVLRDARARKLPFYNTLMLVLALCAHGHLKIKAYGEIRNNLVLFARYGPQVFSVGDAVFEALKQSLQNKAREVSVTSSATARVPGSSHSSGRH